MSSAAIFTTLILGLFLFFSLIAGYLYYKMKKLSSELETLNTSHVNSLPNSSSNEKIEERIRLLELKKSDHPPQQIIKYLPSETVIPGEPGKQGPPGPRGRTLIQDINQLFDGKDEIEIFTRLQDRIPSEFADLDTVISTLSTDEEKAKSIEEIKKTLEKNAKDLHGVNTLRNLKKETNDLCSEVIISYKKYIDSFEKLYRSQEGTADDKIQQALACKIELKNFQNKIDKFNTNLRIISQKKKDFFLGDKAELEADEETTRDIYGEE